MTDKLQILLEYADREAEALDQAADRREAQLQPVTALLFRNEAFRIRNAGESFIFDAGRFNDEEYKRWNQQFKKA